MNNPKYKVYYPWFLCKWRSFMTQLYDNKLESMLLYTSMIFVIIKITIQMVNGIKLIACGNEKSYLPFLNLSKTNLNYYWCAMFYLSMCLIIHYTRNKIIAPLVHQCPNSVTVLTSRRPKISIYLDFKIYSVI